MDDSRLDELLEQWEQRRAQGEQLSAKDLCSEDAQLQKELSCGIDALKRLEWMDCDDDHGATEVP